MEAVAMPMLPPEPNQYPENLFTAAPEAFGSRVWWVLHTKPRQEKSLARHLLQAAIPFYLPVVARRSVIRGRVFLSHVPLFSSYLFLLGEREDRLAALATKRVVQTLEVPEQEGLWRDLRQVSRLIASGAPITPEERLQPGALVEIKSGPLAGLRGQILQVRSGRKFVVQVDFIQKGASVLLDDFNLVPLGEPPP
jgi:transcription antitermination factor NusG